MPSSALSLGIGIAQRLREFEMGFNLSNRRLALLGDSRASLQTQRTFYSQGGTAFVYENGGFINWLRFLSRQKFDFDELLNFGVFGETSDQVLARIPAMLAATDARVILSIMSTNDRGAGPNQPASFSTGNLNAAKALMRSRVNIWADEMPRGDSAFTSQRLAGAQLANQFAVSQYIRGTLHDPVTGNFAVETFDANYDHSTNNGDAILGNMYDGLHQSARGAYASALAMLPLIESLYSERDLRPTSDTGWINPNTQMTGTGGTVGSGWAGSVATSWSGTAITGTTGSTVTGSKVTDAEGVEWQQLVFSGTPTGAGPTHSLQQDLTTGFSVGQTLDAVMQVEWLSTIANVWGISLRVFCLDGASAVIADYRDMDGRTATELLPAATCSGVMRIPNIVIPANTVTVRLALRFFMVQNAAVAGTVRCRAGGIKVVS